MREVNLKEFTDFAQKHVYWWGETRSNINVGAVLRLILARKSAYVENMARERFGFTDDDFCEALHDTPPGLFWGPGAEEHWDEVNVRFGIVPPLPFPKRDIEAEKRELQRMKRMKLQQP